MHVPASRACPCPPLAPHGPKEACHQACARPGHYTVQARLPVHAAEGMQTEETFLTYITRLDKWIDQRSSVEVAAGGAPIERPVVLMLDNHASRFSDEVLQKTCGQAAELGIRIFSEESGTSGFLQALDQFNS